MYKTSDVSTDSLMIDKLNNKHTKTQQNSQAIKICKRRPSCM